MAQTEVENILGKRQVVCADHVTLGFLKPRPPKPPDSPAQQARADVGTNIVIIRRQGVGRAAIAGRQFEHLLLMDVLQRPPHNGDVLLQIGPEFLRKHRISHDCIIDPGKPVAQPGGETFRRVVRIEQIIHPAFVGHADVRFEHRVLLPLKVVEEMR